MSDTPTRVKPPLLPPLIESYLNRQGLRPLHNFVFEVKINGLLFYGFCIHGEYSMQDLHFKI